MNISIIVTIFMTIFIFLSVQIKNWSGNLVVSKYNSISNHVMICNVFKRKEEKIQNTEFEDSNRRAWLPMSVH